MANCSPDLVWGIVKDTSCFLLKKKTSQRSGYGKKGVHLTLEPNNLKGVNSFKYSGLANTKTVGITAGAGNKGIILSKKVTKPERARKVSPLHPSVTPYWDIQVILCIRGSQPSKMFAKTKLTKDFRRVAKAIKAEVEGTHYRPDLTSGESPKPCMCGSIMFIM